MIMIPWTTVSQPLGWQCSVVAYNAKERGSRCDTGMMHTCKWLPAWVQRNVLIEFYNELHEDNVETADHTSWKQEINHDKCKYSCWSSVFHFKCPFTCWFAICRSLFRSLSENGTNGISSRGDSARSTSNSSKIASPLSGCSRPFYTTTW